MYYVVWLTPNTATIVVNWLHIVVVVDRITLARTALENYQNAEEVIVHTTFLLNPTMLNK